MTDDKSHRHVINMAARLVDNQAISYKEDVGDLRQVAAMDRSHDYVPEIKILKDTARILHDIADKVRSLEISSKVEGKSLKFTPVPGFTVEDENKDIPSVVPETLAKNPYGMVLTKDQQAPFELGIDNNGKPIPVEIKNS